MNGPKIGACLYFQNIVGDFRKIMSPYEGTIFGQTKMWNYLHILARALIISLGMICTISRDGAQSNGPHFRFGYQNPPALNFSPQLSCPRVNQTFTSINSTPSVYDVHHSPNVNKNWSGDFFIVAKFIKCYPSWTQ